MRGYSVRRKIGWELDQMRIDATYRHFVDMKTKLENNAASYIMWPMWLYHLKKVKERKKKAAKKAAAKGKKKNTRPGYARTNPAPAASKPPVQT